MVSELLAWVRVLSRVTCILPFDIESLINHLTVPPPPNRIHTNSLLVQTAEGSLPLARIETLVIKTARDWVRQNLCPIVRDKGTF